MPMQRARITSAEAKYTQCPAVRLEEEVVHESRVGVLYRRVEVVLAGLVEVGLQPGDLLNRIAYAGGQLAARSFTS